MKMCFNWGPSCFWKGFEIKQCPLENNIYIRNQQWDGNVRQLKGVWTGGVPCCIRETWSWSWSAWLPARHCVSSPGCHLLCNSVSQTFYSALSSSPNSVPYRWESFNQVPEGLLSSLVSTGFNMEVIPQEVFPTTFCPERKLHKYSITSNHWLKGPSTEAQSMQGSKVVHQLI